MRYEGGSIPGMIRDSFTLHLVRPIHPIAPNVPSSTVNTEAVLKEYRERKTGVKTHRKRNEE